MKNIQRQIRESIDKPKTDVIAEKPRVERRPPPHALALTFLPRLTTVDQQVARLS